MKIYGKWSNDKINKHSSLIEDNIGLFGSCSLLEKNGTIHLRKKIEQKEVKK